MTFPEGFRRDKFYLASTFVYLCGWVAAIGSLAYITFISTTTDPKFEEILGEDELAAFDSTLSDQWYGVAFQFVFLIFWVYVMGTQRASRYRGGLVALLGVNLVYGTSGAELQEIDSAATPHLVFAGGNIGMSIMILLWIGTVGSNSSTLFQSIVRFGRTPPPEHPKTENSGQVVHPVSRNNSMSDEDVTEGNTSQNLYPQHTPYEQPVSEDSYQQTVHPTFFQALPYSTMPAQSLVVFQGHHAIATANPPQSSKGVPTPEPTGGRPCQSMTTVGHLAYQPPHLAPGLRQSSNSLRSTQPEGANGDHSTVNLSEFQPLSLPAGSETLLPQRREAGDGRQAQPRTHRMANASASPVSQPGHPADLSQANALNDRPGRRSRFVVEVQKQDPLSLLPPSAGSQGDLETRDRQESQEPQQANPLIPTTLAQSVSPFTHRARALYSYTADPKDPKELSFVKGEILAVREPRDHDWWPARKVLEDGASIEGIVPSNYMRLL